MTKHYAEEGKVFRSKIDGAYLSNVIILGKHDSLDNYEQVDPPVYEELTEEDENVEDYPRRVRKT